MKTNRVYHGVVVGITSAIMGSTFFTNNVLADETEENQNLSSKDSTIENSSNTSNVDKVIVEPNQSDGEAQLEDASTEQTKSDDTNEDVVWEPAPPLTKAQDRDYDETSGNQTSNGIVKPHAQKKASPKAKKSAHNSSRKAVNHAHASISSGQFSNKAAVNRLKTKSITPSLNRDNDKQIIKASTKETEYKILPETGERDDESIVIGTALFLSSVGLLGVKRRKKIA